MPDLSYPLINGSYASANSAIIKIAGLQFVGFKALEYDDDLKPGDVRGTHARILGRTTGVESAKGSMELFLPEFKALLSALKVLALTRFGGPSGWKQVEFNIMAGYGENALDITQDELIGCRITSVGAGFSSGSADALTRKCGLSIVNINWDGSQSLAFPLAGVPFL